MTPEELAKEAMRRVNYASINHTYEVARVAAELALSKWQPTPKPSHRVMARTKWLEEGSRFEVARVAQEEAFDAGYAAAVKEADILVRSLQDWHSGTITAQTHDQVSRSTLATYLTAIGDETP